MFWARPQVTSRQSELTRMTEAIRESPALSFIVEPSADAAKWSDGRTESFVCELRKAIAPVHDCTWLPPFEGRPWAVLVFRLA